MRQSFSARNYSTGEDDPWEDIYEEDDYDEDDPYRCFMDDDTIESKASSAMDCTGLIPSLPESEEELASYAEVYRYSGDILQD